jgi:hypothetical protein
MTDELLSRIAENLVGRVSGPMKFRLVLQPLMAVFFAVKHGLQDARDHRPAYFWAIFTEPDVRRDLLREGWQDIGKIFVIAIAIDAVYQYVVFRWFYPFESIIVAVVLALIPYLLVRGPVNRIARR